MRRILPLAIAVGLLAGADDPQAGNTEEEMKKLRGAWTMVSLEVNGEQVPEDRIAAAKLVVEGDRYTATLGDRTVASTITVDPTKTPKAINMTYTDGPQKGQTVKGIYKLDGERLTMCRGLRAEDERPTEFSTGAESGLILVVWSRAKAADNTKD